MTLLDRLFLEGRRRTKIIPHAFGERPVLKLIHTSGDPRGRPGITVGEFERPPLRAIREELDRAHAERIKPPMRPVVPAAPSRLSSKNQT